MKRREFITLAGGAAAWPFAAAAQQPAATKRIAIVHPDDKSNMNVNGGPAYKAFFEELRDLGHVEGQNLLVERYSGEGRTDHYAELARDVASTHPDLIFSLSPALVQMAARSRIPAICPFKVFAEIGGLLAYAVDLPDAVRRSAGLVDKILKGAKPGDLPFEQPTKFELIVNMKTAKALGLELPAMLVARADQVIE
jgi:hypothetical protein